MKKSLFALAAFGAFAGAAQAQSSVTVYGIMDVGFTGGQARAGASKEQVNRFSNSMESGSRLGFRGNEDLGGGLSAQFVFELGINPAGDNMSNTWTPNIRQGFVGLSQKGLGTARIGTQNTLFWEQAGANTTGQLAQTAGSMLAPTIVGTFYGTTALNQSTDLSFANQAANNLSSGSSSAAYTVRTPNTINFRTERMAGVVVKASWTQSDSNSTSLPARGTGANLAGYRAGTNNQQGWQAAFDWNIQKANIQASYAAFKSENPYGNIVYGVNTNGGAQTLTQAGNPQAWGVTGGVNVNDTQALVTASYDFGILKAYAGWTDRKVTSTINSNEFAKRTAQEIGVRGYVTKTIEGWASVGNGRYTAYGASSPTANITGYQVGSNYWLSKRSNLYAIFGQNGTSGTSAAPAMNISQYSVGIRHTF